MLFRSLLRQLNWDPARSLGDRSRLRPKPAHTRRPVSRVPWLEILEDRTVPSTFMVTSAADDGSAGTLRAVLARAQSGDTIHFATQLQGKTITLTQGQLAVNKSLAIDGLGPDKLTISGNAASRIFDVSSGATVTISDLTLANGLSTDGAGILNAGNLSLSNDVLSANVAQGVAGGGLFSDGGGRGGGVENEAGATLAVSHSTFTSNEALGGPNGGNAFGGGIYNEAGTVTIDQSVFTGNQAVAANGGSVGIAATMPGGISATLLGVATGGGVWNDGGSITVSNSSLSNNLDEGGSNGDASGSTATFEMVDTAIGGAIGSGAFFTTATPTLAITGSTLSGNQAVGGTNVVDDNLFAADAGTGRGGGIGAVAGNVSAANSTISDNLAQGGGLFTGTAFGIITVVQGSAAFGGGIYHEFNLGFSPPPALMTLNIMDSTISRDVALGNGPSAQALGGGVYASFANAQVSNSTVSGNQAVGGPGGGFESFFGSVFPFGGGSSSGGGIQSNGGSLSISGGTVKDNLAQGGPGGATAADGAGGGAGGGGIVSSGQVFVLVNSTLSGNQAVGGDATLGDNASGGAGSGGLGMSRDSATISGATFVNNVAQAGGNNASPFGGQADGAGALADRTSLQMSDSTFTGNEALGGAGKAGSNGDAGARGGSAFAGGLHLVRGIGTNTISNTSFVRNLAQGGPGGAGDTGGAGGAGGGGFGGGLVHDIATTAISNSSFIQDVAQGGAGGAGGAGARGGAGGSAFGGAVYNVLAFVFGFPSVTSLTLSDSSIAQNQAVGGAGGAAGTGSTGGNGGRADGGGFFSSRLGIAGQVTLTIISNSVTGNDAIGGTGADGGNGGNDRGGAFFIDAGTIAALSNSTLVHNLAAGGAAEGGGNGGNGLGGGIYVANDASVSVTGSTIINNRAVGGEANDGGSAGQGIGGGVYNLGAFFLDAASIIDHNHASTSNDNVFGTITPI